MGWESVAALAAVLFGTTTLVQSYLAWSTDKRYREDEKRYREDEKRNRDRQRDTEMTRWGGEVIDVMAEIETACAPLTTENAYGPAAIEALSHRASALVDRGRLFFPNVQFENRSAVNDEGIRVRVLDQVLRACYVARHMVVHGNEDGLKLRGQVWEARRRFVILLQNEMAGSLREVGADSAGDHVPIDPRLWAPPTRPLKLPASDIARNKSGR
ncbi:hypothetical protein FJ527_01005 [Mesorhizobium sp. B2-4-18]|uniref:hypothetical protein n=1 Tax=Mesorhizobium sp. B2-4-18 TaxID=2589931 RepID=UPI00112DF7C3|nr:hypothetical protein [Mesorhizobium sp. B2-4-18]TPK80385.1 hypothetical protein FJ527_01005 [Mesorhizobium sp. B2-4-18]